MKENKKAMLFTLNAHSQYLLDNALPRTKSKTVDNALRFYHEPGPAGYFVDVDDLPPDLELGDITIYKLHTNRKAYDVLASSLSKAQKRIRQQDNHIEELLDRAGKKRRFFELWRRK